MGDRRVNRGPRCRCRAGHYSLQVRTQARSAEVALECLVLVHGQFPRILDVYTPEPSL